MPTDSPVPHPKSSPSFHDEESSKTSSKKSSSRRSSSASRVRHLQQSLNPNFNNSIPFRPSPTSPNYSSVSEPIYTYSRGKLKKEAANILNNCSHGTTDPPYTTTRHSGSSNSFRNRGKEIIDRRNGNLKKLQISTATNTNSQAPICNDPYIPAASLTAKNEYHSERRYSHSRHNSNGRSHSYRSRSRYASSTVTTRGFEKELNPMNDGTESAVSENNMRASSTPYEGYNGNNSHRTLRDDRKTYVSSLARSIGDNHTSSLAMQQMESKSIASDPAIFFSKNMETGYGTAASDAGSLSTTTDTRSYYSRGGASRSSKPSLQVDTEGVEAALRPDDNVNGTSAAAVSRASTRRMQPSRELSRNRSTNGAHPLQITLKGTNGEGSNGKNSTSARPSSPRERLSSSRSKIANRDDRRRRLRASYPMNQGWDNIVSWGDDGPPPSSNTRRKAVGRSNNGRGNGSGRQLKSSSAVLSSKLLNVFGSHQQNLLADRLKSSLREGQQPPPQSQLESRTSSGHQRTSPDEFTLGSYGPNHRSNSHNGNSSVGPRSVTESVGSSTFAETVMTADTESYCIQKTDTRDEDTENDSGSANIVPPQSNEEQKQEPKQQKKKKDHIPDEYMSWRRKHGKAKDYDDRTEGTKSTSSRPEIPSALKQSSRIKCSKLKDNKGKKVRIQDASDNDGTDSSDNEKNSSPHQQPPPGGSSSSSNQKKPTSIGDLLKDPMYSKVCKSGLLWQSLVGEFVRFPSTWYDGERHPPMGMEYPAATPWKYISRHHVRGNANLNGLVKKSTSRGRILLHIVVQDLMNWGPSQDIAIGCFHPSAKTVRLKLKKANFSSLFDDPFSKDDGREVWLAVRKKSDEEKLGGVGGGEMRMDMMKMMGSKVPSLIDPWLAQNCDMELIARPSPLGERKYVNSSNIRSVFGDEPPVKTIIILESELYQITQSLTRKQKVNKRLSPALLLLQEFVFKNM